MNTAPKPILSDFDRMFEELPEPTDSVTEMVRKAVEHVAAGDRKQIQRPTVRAEA